MSDLDLSAAAEDAAATPPPPPPPPPPPSASDEEIEGLLDESGEMHEQYPREVVEKLRRENARRRVEARELEAVWDGYTEAQRETMTGLIRGFVEGSRETYDDLGTVMANLADRLGIEEDHVSDTTPAQEPQEASGLTSADIQRIVDERLAEAQRERGVKDTYAKAAALDPGYTRGNADLTKLLFIAEHYPEAEQSLEKAHEIIQAERAEIRRQAVEEYQASLRGAPPPRMPATAGVSEPAKEPKTLEEAFELAAELEAAGYAASVRGQIP